jgi:hypothetical protein
MLTALFPMTFRQFVVQSPDICQLRTNVAMPRLKDRRSRDGDPISAELGPRVALCDGLRKTIDWFKTIDFEPFRPLHPTNNGFCAYSIFIVESLSFRTLL